MDNFRKKITKQTPKKGKKSCWKHCSNSRCFVMKATAYCASPHNLALFVMSCNCNSQITQY